MVSFGLCSDFRVGLCVISQRTKNISYQSFFKSRMMNNNVISFLFTWHLSGCMENTVSGLVPWGARMLTYTGQRSTKTFGAAALVALKDAEGTRFVWPWEEKRSCWGPTRSLPVPMRRLLRRWSQALTEICGGRTVQWSWIGAGDIHTDYKGKLSTMKTVRLWSRYPKRLNNLHPWRPVWIKPRTEVQKWLCLDRRLD